MGEKFKRSDIKQFYFWQSFMSILKHRLIRLEWITIL
jgi:hypothetical protein